MSLALAVQMNGLEFWFVTVDVVSDGHDQLFNVAEDAAAQPVLREVPNKALDHIEPRGTGRREVHMKAQMPFQPVLLQTRLELIWQGVA